MLGTKVGMTRVFDEAGVSVPVTVIKAGPCVVTQVRTEPNDGYWAVQVGYGSIKARNSTIPMIGHDAAAGSVPLRHHHEFRVSAEEAQQYSPGQELTAEALRGLAFVDVTGVSKGKGFAGSIKRHHFKGQLATHGVERKHRSPGSIAGHASNPGKSGRIKKGKRMAGHMGAERVTVRSLDVVRVDEKEGLLLVKGPVPGPSGGLLEIRPAIRLYRSKAEAAKKAAD